MHGVQAGLGGPVTPLTDGRTDGRTNERTNERTDGTDERTDGHTCNFQNRRNDVRVGDGGCADQMRAAVALWPMLGVVLSHEKK